MTTLSVPDMSCNHCKTTIEAALGRSTGTPVPSPLTWGPVKIEVAGPAPAAVGCSRRSTRRAIPRRSPKGRARRDPAAVAEARRRKRSGRGRRRRPTPGRPPRDPCRGRCRSHGRSSPWRWSGRGSGAWSTIGHNVGQRVDHPAPGGFQLWAAQAPGRPWRKRPARSDSVFMFGVGFRMRVASNGVASSRPSGAGCPGVGKAARGCGWNVDDRNSFFRIAR